LQKLHTTFESLETDPNALLHRAQRAGATKYGEIATNFLARPLRSGASDCSAYLMRSG